MRIGVFSDSHGKIDSIRKGIELIGNIDIILHAGDNYSDAIKISKEYNIETIAVKGNTDYLVKEDTEKVFLLAGKKIFLTHGHNYYVKNNLNNLYYRSLELDNDITIFGHSHIPVHIEYGNKIFINPGSTALPRGGSRPTCGLLEIDEKGNISFSFINIE